MNMEYRNKIGPTDVIAFAMRDGEFADLNSNLLGDIVISLDTAKRQSVEDKKEIWEEVRFLLIHGILHLHGYNHVDDDEKKKKMENKEKELLMELTLI